MVHIINEWSIYNIISDWRRSESLNVPPVHDAESWYGEAEKQTKTDERSLWHGTDVAAVVQNYNVSYHLFSATLFGKGVYFAMKTEYPAGWGYANPNINGHKRIYKSLVLTEDFAQGDSDTPVPPINPSNPGFNFDSTVDDMSNPIMFVEFLDNIAYSKYLITFTWMKQRESAIASTLWMLECHKLAFRLLLVLVRHSPFGCELVMTFL